MKCRHCASDVTLPFIDLGSAPPSNAYLTEDALRGPERWYPLKVLVCTECWLVQTEDYAHSSELFSDDYAYFSSFSSTWLRHAGDYVDSMSKRFKLNGDSFVVEIASNDGYLLQYVRARGIPCLGIEPTASTARAAREKGIEVLEKFFSVEFAEELATAGRSADLIAANNVLAHVPDINDFVKGVSLLLKTTGVVTFEFPHLLNLVSDNQFDTIYHEHYSYLSLAAVTRILQGNGLTVFDVEEYSTHGGSLRVFARRADAGKREISENVARIAAREIRAGIKTADFYTGFQSQAEGVKSEILRFLLNAQQSHKAVVAYGAAAKGNTLMNYAGIRSDLIQFVVDRNPAKQSKFMPGSRIPIVDENRLRTSKPDYVVILPWNLKSEISHQIAYVRDWGAKIVTAIPHLEIA